MRTTPTRVPDGTAFGAAGRPLLAALLLAGLAACSEAAGQAEAEEAQRRAGALDEILLCEDSDERTPIVFPHRLHYGPRDEGGRAIECASCHHDYAGPDGAPPSSCRSCHEHHDVAVEKRIDSL